MGFLKPDVKFPDPVDPTQAIQEQGTQNVDAAIATALLNQVNQIGPGGQTIFSPTGQITDVGGRDIPQFQQTTTLTPEGQAQFEAQQQLGADITGLASSNVGAVAGAQGTPFSFAGLQGITPQQFTGAGQDRFGGLNPTTGIQAQLFKEGLPGLRRDFGEQGRELEQATFQQARGLLDPVFAEQRQQADVRLSERGLPVGSEASGNLLNPLLRSQNLALQQAALGSVGAGRQEQGRLFQQQQQQRGQAFGERLGTGQFRNQAAAQLFGQKLGAGQFRNQALQQEFGQDLAARQQGIQERAFERSLPINEIAALLGTAPGVQIPGFVQTPGVGVSAPDVIGGTLGAQNLNLQSALGAQQAASSGLGGLFGLAGSLGSAALLSDRRQKRDIKRIGTWRDNALYSFRYVGEFIRKIGVMAQEIDPRAVIEVGGMKYVNYGAL